MTGPPKVSVVIPAYNCGPYLGAALESVFTQSFRDYEVVVVNDGSTDSTDQVVAPYRGRIAYITGSNRGASAARNAGIRCSRGELIAFLDADDVWHREKLAQQFQLLDAHPDIGLCFTDYVPFGSPVPYSTGFEERGSALLRYPRRSIAAGAYALAPRGSVLEEFLRHQAFPKPSTVMVRRRLLDRVGEFDETLAICEDTQMWLRLARYATFAYIDRCLVCRRIRADSHASAPDEARYRAVHIQMLETLARWIPLTRAEARAARQLLARYRLAAGYADFAAYQLRLARHHLLRSLLAHVTAAALRYLLLSFAPAPALRLLRELKRGLSLIRGVGS